MKKILFLAVICFPITAFADDYDMSPSPQRQLDDMRSEQAGQNTLIQDQVLDMQYQQQKMQRDMQEQQYEMRQEQLQQRIINADPE